MLPAAFETETEAIRDAAWLPALVDQAQDYAHAAIAPNTRRAYRADWADFTQWC